VNVFTYGSLMYDRVWSRVVTGQYARQNGVVKGFQRLQIKNESYPGLIKGKGRVTGVVYLAVSAEDVTRLDRFEGELYRREMVEVICSDGRHVPAAFYLIKDQFKNLLAGEWSQSQFELHGLAKFEAKYVGFEWM
jgi:gamma-glutamylcyclotransferase (GGCT)/AIG2-like uncharacterized protein YtfP